MTAIDPRRFAAVEARHEIENLIARYCMACDDRDIPALVGLYTDDGYFGADSGGGAQGRAAIEATYRQRLGLMGPTYHWTHDRLIELDPDDMNKATGVALAHCEISVDGVGYVAGMRYYDRYRREAGVWKFARRGFRFLYFVPASEAATALTQPNRVWRYGVWQAADIPEPLETWKAFHAQASRAV